MGNPLWSRLMLVTVVMLVAFSARIYWQLWQIGAGSHYALAWLTGRAELLCYAVFEYTTDGIGESGAEGHRPR